MADYREDGLIHGARVVHFAGQRVVPLLALLAALLMVGTGCAYIDVKQKEFIWRPSPTTWWSKFDVKANGVAELWIARNGESVVPAVDAADEGNGDRLHVWWWRHPRAEAPVMLYLHGARWNLQGNAFRIARLRDMGFSVLAIDYRGFGRSGGDLPSEADAYADAAIAWDYVKKLAPEASRRYLYGHSLGGAIAIELATRGDDLAGIIVESTFTSIRDLAGTYTLGRILPIGWFLTQHYDSLSRIEKVHVPKLFVHGANDRFVPAWMTERLYERANGAKRLLLVEGANHSNSTGVGFEQYRVALQEMFGLRQHAALQ
ncbi:MAG: alpha/beta fold hydrolase [Betaproteobacteria bacterium]|nr:alpha/beta fold hydrolase [Betaproteobacteria bacterium]